MPFKDELIRGYLDTLPDKKAVVTLSWSKDLPDFGTGKDHFVVGFVKGDTRYTDTVVVKDGSKPTWGDTVLLESNDGTHPFVSMCKDCENCSSCDKEEVASNEDAQ